MDLLCSISLGNLDVGPRIGQLSHKCLEELRCWVGGSWKATSVQPGGCVVGAASLPRDMGRESSWGL